MKNKLLAAACAVSLLASAAALVSVVSGRARAAVTDDSMGALQLVARNASTEIYAVQHGPLTCMVASTRAGSGISVSCQKVK
jgi:hypothetical protein